MFICCMSAFDIEVFAQSVKSNQAKKESKKKTLPTAKKANSPVSITLGKKLYSQYQCFDCHKIAGKGCESGFSLVEKEQKGQKLLFESIWLILTSTLTNIRMPLG